MSKNTTLYCGILGEVPATLEFDRHGKIVDIVLQGVVLSPQRLSGLMSVLPFVRGEEDGMQRVQVPRE